jgi:iron complex transport system ATP-binding protein
VSGVPAVEAPDARGLAVERVRVAFGGCPVVVDFSDRVGAGEWLCIIGPNGAGKSSLLKAVAGVLPHDGAVRVSGADLAGVGARARAARVAFVPQAPVLPADMSVEEYVLLGRNPHVRPFARETARDREVVADVIARLDLAPYARRPLDTLSGGERQRLVIARALAQEAPVLLLDEPTSALDIGHQQHALELVDALRRERGLAVVSAMHDLTLAGLYADRLVLLHQGVRVASGTAQQVLRSETLAEFYGVAARVEHQADGTVVVVPQRATR